MKDHAMKDMTEAEARAEAIRRWGANGTIVFLPPRPGLRERGRSARYSCIVANGPAGSFHSIEGQGNTWREAFEDASRR